VILPFYPWCNTGHDPSARRGKHLRAADGHDPFKVIVDKRPGSWQAQVDADL